MAEVTVVLKGQWVDVEAVLNRMDVLLSLTNVPGSADAQIAPDGGTVYIFNADADERPGSEEQYQFDRLNPAIYLRLIELYKSAWVDLKTLEREGVMKRGAPWQRETLIFARKLIDYLDSIGVEWS